jgi:DNA-binding response OmpR family regulator
MNIPRILMIEDDQRLAAMVVSYLQQNGFEIEHAATGAEGLAQLQRAALNQPDSQPFSLVLLDLMLPDANGLDICRQIRSLQSTLAQVAIVMLTAKGDAMDQVVGLELGADDYVAKPFEPRQLLARLRAVLRRPNLLQEKRVLRFGRLEIDLDSHTVRVDGSERSITSYQFELLVVLAERAGRVLSRETLIDAVKGTALEAFDRSIDVHIGRLRNAIEDDPKHPRRIITVRGAGYLFAKLQDA